MLIFVGIVLAQLCVILVRNGLFYKKTKWSNLVTISYYVIDTVYIYSWKKINKLLTVLVMLYVKSIFFWFTHDVQLDDGVNSPCVRDPSYHAFQIYRCPIKKSN